MIKNKMKYILAMRPNFLTPPYAKIPSYITTFQSSPVNIYFMMIGKMVEMSILDRSKGIKWTVFKIFSKIRITWKTVNRLWKKLSKLARGFSNPLSPWNSLNFPPKSWDPSNAKIPRMRNNKRSRDAIASMELINDLSKFWSAFQYLQKQ